MAKYTPTNWQDSLFDEEGNRVQKGTALSASNLNKIEQGVKATDDKVEDAKTAITGLPKRSELDAVNQQLAETASQKADKTYVETLDVRISDIIQSADLDPNKDQEIVESRYGEATLGTKIGKIDSEINNLSEVAKVAMLNMFKYSLAETSIDFTGSGRRIHTNPDGSWTQTTSANFNPTHQTFDIVQGHKYFAKLKVKDTSVSSLGQSVYILFNDGTRSSFTSPTILERKEISGIIIPEKSGIANVYFTNSTNPTFSMGVLAKEYQLFIDLTDTFGVGKEPTAEEMTAILEEVNGDGFEGSINLLTAKETYHTLNELKKSFEPYVIPDNSIENKHVVDSSLSLNKLDFIEASTNLLNPDSDTRRYVINNVGEMVYDISYSTTDYIKIDPSTPYSFYGIRHASFHDDSFNFLVRMDNVLAGASGTTLSPHNAKYMRCGYKLSDPFTPRIINKGNTILTHEPFYTKFKNGLSLEGLNKVIEKEKDSYMLDLPVDGVFSTNEVYADYTSFGTSMTSEVYSMFDALMATYPNYISKEFLGNDATGLPINVYYFTPSFPVASVDTKTPKVFLTCGTHGAEKASTLTTYLMLKEMCEKWEEDELLEVLRYNVKFIIIPVVTPWAWDNNKRINSNGVDINRNFPHDWVQDTFGSQYYGGTSPLSELEAQYVKSVFDNNPDIDIMYDFHNFFSSGNSNYFMWIPTFSGEYVQHMAQNLFSRLTRKWKKEYDFIPDDWYAGYTSNEGMGMIQTYARSVGIKFSATFEIRWLWLQEAGSTPYNQTMCKSGVEALTNWMLINLKELIK